MTTQTFLHVPSHLIDTRVSHRARFDKRRRTNARFPWGNPHGSSKPFSTLSEYPSGERPDGESFTSDLHLNSQEIICTLEMISLNAADSNAGYQLEKAPAICQAAAASSRCISTAVVLRKYSEILLVITFTVFQSLCSLQSFSLLR